MSDVGLSSEACASPRGCGFVPGKGWPGQGPLLSCPGLMLITGLGLSEGHVPTLSLTLLTSRGTGGHAPARCRLSWTRSSPCSETPGRPGDAPALLLLLLGLGTARHLQDQLPLQGAAPGNPVHLRTALGQDKNTISAWPGPALVRTWRQHPMASEHKRSKIVSAEVSHASGSRAGEGT